ncbi:NAD(P)H-hydrate dehydratase [Aureimonas leprariae]|uniref:Bifunctional NAD(P)H-hydrate repair enzyme n=1 Tax=Plantimonas leprariae TaxID=2615207 RepID=A0A7V7PKV9_9HYPH|nr:NAD(P)H-hydrate dehydratase [Aureimonas leprariae]KAB0676688.1 NAD(P)H-hydrate dehydratase [Aureimonas leprariae]
MSDLENLAALLTPAEMQAADRLTIDAGLPGIVLMEQAGIAVADAVRERFPGVRSVALLAGPGNNGGDAFVVGRILGQSGIAVRLHLLGEQEALRGDAALATKAFGRPVEPLEAFDPSSVDLVIDGLFGAGLAREIDGVARGAIEKANASGRPIVAIDLPSGVSGTSGAVLGVAAKAALTVTFFRRKPGHLLEPGRSLCGETIVADIGISPSVLDTIRPTAFANEPSLWREAFAAPAHAGHKYDRGHAVVFSGGATRTGAGRMSATAALRIGAGLVTVFSPASALLVNAAHLTAVMLQRCEDQAELEEHLQDTRLNAFVIGPGFGIGEKARVFVLSLLAAGRHVVIDADAISSFKDDVGSLFAAVRSSGGSAVLTPHAGEFARLFRDIADGDGSKLDKARAAAERSGAVVVDKGSDTVVAAPDGRAAINATGTPYLATAGSGDVLAGMIAGLLSQKLPAFDAACAAVWLHGRAAEGFGPGLIAEDLPSLIPGVMAGLFETP